MEYQLPKAIKTGNTLKYQGNPRRIIPLAKRLSLEIGVNNGFWIRVDQEYRRNLKPQTT